MQNVPVNMVKKICVSILILIFLLLTGCQKYHKLEKDVPVYRGARFERLFADNSNKQKKHELWIVAAPIGDVSKFYQDELEKQKWKKEMVVPSPDGNGYALAYIKKKKMLTVILFARAGNEKETYIDFSVAKIPK